MGILKRRPGCKKNVSFRVFGDDEDEVDVFPADSYDRRPVPPAINLTESDIRELEELHNTLCPNSPLPKVCGIVPLLPLGPQCSTTRPAPLRSPPPTLTPRAVLPVASPAPARDARGARPNCAMRGFTFMPLVPVTECATASQEMPPSPNSHWSSSPASSPTAPASYLSSPYYPAQPASSKPGAQTTVTRQQAPFASPQPSPISPSSTLPQSQPKRFTAPVAVPASAPAASSTLSSSPIASLYRDPVHPPSPAMRLAPTDFRTSPPYCAPKAGSGSASPLVRTIAL